MPNSTETNFKLKWVEEFLVPALLLICLVTAVAIARRDRSTNETVLAIDRPMIRVPLPQPPPAIQKATDELKEAEAKAKTAKAELEQISADLEAKKQNLENLKDETTASAAQARTEIEDSRKSLEAEREKLQQLADATDQQVKAAKVELQRIEAERQRQLAAAARAGVAEGFGRVGGVAPQNQFDPSRRRDPSFASAGTNPAAVEMDNRLRWTETFFENRRINRAARALEAGPRTTMEQAVKFARMQAPRQLTSLELDPATGAISWPILLTDPLYDNYTHFLEDLFKERAAGGVVDYERDTSFKATMDEFKATLKENVSRYPAGKYGQAKTFLDSLLYEYQLPAD